MRRGPRRVLLRAFGFQRAATHGVGASAFAAARVANSGADDSCQAARGCPAGPIACSFRTPYALLFAPSLSAPQHAGALCRTRYSG